MDVEVHHIRALRDLNVKGRPGKAQVGTNHGGEKAEDPRGLPSLPPERPRRQLESAQAQVGSVSSVVN